MALEELGTTFIKIGQLLSTRPDLLSPAYIAELSKLQASVSPIDAEIVRAVIAEELGAKPEVLFASFDSTPLASSSIGQAHAAIRHDGTPVVVKVRRPGVVEQIHDDLEILQNLAAQASRHWDLAGLDHTQIDRGDVIDIVVDAIAQMVFVDGPFNADPHPGNFSSRPTDGSASSTLEWLAASTPDWASVSPNCLWPWCGEILAASARRW